MAILGKLLSGGLQDAGEDIVEKGVSKAIKKASKEGGESILSKLGKRIPVSYTDDIAQDIAVKAPEMVKVYRGMAAKTDDDLKQYLSDMVDYNIKPRTYSGLNVSGEGYNFTTNPVGATAYVTSNPVKESRVVLTTELPKNRFIQQNAANQNRLQDFISRAESRGIPYEGGASERAAKKDMEAYFKKNGLLGVRNNSGQIFVVNQNDPEWIDKLAVDKAMRGRRSNIVDDTALKNDLGSILKTANVQNDLDNASKFLQPKEPLTLYHGSPTKGIKDLDINMAGKNTMSGERAIYFTDDYPTAETFSYERSPSNSMFVDNRGNKGEVYTRNVNTNNFLDLDNLTDDQIADLYNYIDPRSAGLMDKNKFIQTLNDARAAGNSQMIKAQLDLNKLADDYDGFMAKMYPGENDIREYGVFNPQNIITPDVEQYLPKKLDVSGGDATQNIPVYTKDDFITDPSIFDDPAFADIVKNNNIENVMKKATKSDLDLVKRAKAGKDKRVSGYAKISNDVKFGEPQILEEISPSDVLKRVQNKFGKSVVVDKKGKPLDLYHGTDASFDKFGDIKTEPGYWFTEDKDYAQSHGKNLMTVNLDMRNPIDMNTADGEDLLYDLARERFGIKGVVPEDKIFSKEFREFLQDKGYDGLIWDKDGKNTYVAFKPEQIKIRDK